MQRAIHLPARPALAGAFALLSLVVWTAPALAVKGTVLDGGDMFSDAAVEKADGVIRQIKQAYGKDVVVETYRSIPADLRAEFQKRGKEAFYAEWLAQRAKALGIDGVFILITREPGRFQLGVGGETANAPVHRRRPRGTSAGPHPGVPPGPVRRGTGRRAPVHPEADGAQRRRTRCRRPAGAPEAHRPGGDVIHAPSIPSPTTLPSLPATLPSIDVPAVPSHVEAAPATRPGAQPTEPLRPGTQPSEFPSRAAPAGLPPATRPESGDF